MNLCVLMAAVVVGVLIPHVSATCDGCKTTWDASGKACGDDDTYISCLLDAASSDAGCDTRNTKMAEAKTHRDGITPACTALTTTCGCQVTYHSTDLTSGACTPAKDAIKCLVAATDDGCTGATTTARKDIVKAFNTIVTDTTSCDLTDTCKCETAYSMADVAAAADKCTKLKEEMHCLMSANGVGCDGSSARSAVANTLDGLIVDSVANCKTDLTDTCKCQIAYAKTAAADNPAKCTNLKVAMHCLVKADGMGCDGTAKRSAVATTLDALIVDTIDNCRTGLTGTCTCAIAYAKTDTTDKSNKCTAANTATTCLEAITTTENACDGSTVTKTYLNETITPIVTEACSSGTVVLLSVWVAAACVLSGMIQQ